MAANTGAFDGIDTHRKEKVCVVLPTTSSGGRKGEDECLSEILQVSKGLALAGPDFEIHVFLCLDEEDLIYDTRTEDKVSIVDRIQGSLRETRITFRAPTYFKPPTLPLSPNERPVAKICEMWRQVTQKAYEEFFDYYVLLGDDLKILTQDWMNLIREEYAAIQSRRGVPFGFGCVAFNDITFPAFPTFPVMHRKHMDIFDGSMLPEVFINQDGDPYLYDVYRRWGASVIIRGCQLSNGIGGTNSPRYTPLSVDWKHEILEEGVARVESFLERECIKATRFLVMDVIVPCYRCDLRILKNIVALAVPEDTSTQFIIIIDYPDHPNEETIKKFEEQNILGSVRVRSNLANSGAAISRNRGLDESSADWVVFLDDDIEPREDLLSVYASEIRSHGNKVQGFAGIILFPHPPPSQFTAAVEMSFLNFWFGIAGKLDRVPWCTTANLAVQRTRHQFEDLFPKTGGGEDVHFCLQLDKWPMRAVPEAVVTHPWWREGNRDYGRFFGWARGDGAVMDLHPTFTYRTCPTPTEISLVLVALVSVGTISIMDLMLAFGSMALADCGMDIIHHCVNEPGVTAPTVKGIARVCAAMEGTLCRNVNEVGRIWGHLICRGQFWNLCKQFDWFCGLYPSKLEEEKWRRFWRFVVYIVAIVASRFLLQPWLSSERSML